MASRRGKLSYVKLLLQAGADLNRPNKQGVSPLQYAIDKGGKTVRAVISYLREQGALAFRVPPILQIGQQEEEDDDDLGFLPLPNIEGDDIMCGELSKSNSLF